MKSIITKSTFLAISLFISFSFLSCEDETGDTTRPEIDLIAPADGAVLKIGSDIHFDMVVSDNEMLASYKVDIHNNFDNHDHSRATNADGDMPFVFQKTWNLPKQREAKIHHHEIVIPEDATPGPYHLIVFCTDEAGNESHVVHNIVLSHDAGDHDHDHDHDHH